jgi:hypothetical protein
MRMHRSTRKARKRNLRAIVDDLRRIGGIIGAAELEREAHSATARKAAAKRLAKQDHGSAGLLGRIEA